MIGGVIGMMLGCVLGLAVAGVPGAMMGVVVGAALGLLWTSTVATPLRPAFGAPLLREECSLLCIPGGQVAQVTLVRDARSGQCLDVERCTLCRPAERVACRKRCLVLARDVLPRRPAGVSAGSGS